MRLIELPTGRKQKSVTRGNNMMRIKTTPMHTGLRKETIYTFESPMVVTCRVLHTVVRGELCREVRADADRSLPVGSLWLHAIDLWWEKSDGKVCWTDPTSDKKPHNFQLYPVLY